MNACNQGQKPSKPKPERPAIPVRSIGVPDPANAERILALLGIGGATQKPAGDG